MKLVTKWTNRNEKARERYQICLECEHMEKNFGICKKCGCWLKGKTQLPGASCPIGKWKDYEEKTNG